MCGRALQLILYRRNLETRWRPSWRGSVPPANVLKQLLFVAQSLIKNDAFNSQKDVMKRQQLVGQKNQRSDPTAGCQLLCLNTRCVCLRLQISWQRTNTPAIKFRMKVRITILTCKLLQLLSLTSLGKYEVKGRRERRRKQLLLDLQEEGRYWTMKDEALDRTLWRTRFGRGFGPVVRETKERRININLWRNKSLKI